jgi:hypothetical protein
VRDVIYEPRNYRTRNYLEAKQNAWPIVVLVAGDWIGYVTGILDFNAFPIRTAVRSPEITGGHWPITGHFIETPT